MPPEFGKENFWLRPAFSGWSFFIVPAPEDYPFKMKAMLKRITILVTLFLLLAGNMNAAGAGQGKVLTVAAAASNAFALKKIAVMFERDTGVKVNISFGSSGLLARQIEKGAPFDLLFSANIKYVDWLKRRGAVVPGSIRVYAEGGIVLAVNRSYNLRAKRLKDLLNPGIKRVAIANPDYAPYGTAAMEAMKAAGVWERLKGKLVYGENIRQTLQFIQSGNAQAGIIALSIADVGGISYTVIGPAMHKPIEQAGAITSTSKHKKTARDFIDYVNGPKGRAVLRSFGFTPPAKNRIDIK